MAAKIKEPLFVIGTHRSGTTLLGRALGHHPEIAYWEEPRHVWSWGHNYRRNDVLTAADAGPRVSRHIRGRFARFLESSRRPRFAEKTPSNCLRLEFIHEIFPDALFVHIFREGRAVINSTAVVTRTRTPDTEWYAQRLFGTPIWEWPALLPRAWRTLGRKLLGRDMAFWGPRPPGWQEWLQRDSRLAILAKQWRFSIEPVLEFGARQPGSKWLDIRYEALVTDPVAHAKRIESFAGLTTSPGFHEHLHRECHSDSVNAWRSHLTGPALEELRPIVEPVLLRLGYDW